MRFGSTLAIVWLSAFLALGACDGPNINGSVVDDFGTASTA
jgi:hypothetical protein